MRKTRILTLVSTFAMGVSPANAGEFARGADGAPLYRFTQCTAPVAADLRGSRQKKIRAYNAHVAAVEAYVACLQDEAQNDIDAHFEAISAAFHATQKSALDEADRLRKALGLVDRSTDLDFLGGPEDPR